jgi:hypothetical protein
VPELLKPPKLSRSARLVLNPMCTPAVDGYSFCDYGGAERIHGLINDTLTALQLAPHPTVQKLLGCLAGV